MEAVSRSSNYKCGNVPSNGMRIASNRSRFRFLRYRLLVNDYDYRLLLLEKTNYLITWLHVKRVLNYPFIGDVAVSSRFSERLGSVKQTLSGTVCRGSGEPPFLFEWLRISLFIWRTPLRSRH